MAKLWVSWNIKFYILWRGKIALIRASRLTAIYSESMIEVSGLTKRFGSTVAVDDLSFAVGRGEVLGFLGPNGAGKSTTMKMISGFLAPDRGSVRIGGIDVESEPIKAKAQLGYLPEGIPLYAEMPVHSFLAFVGRTRGIRAAELAARIAAAVDAVRLADVLTKPIAGLSKGYKRRVGIAQALLHDPPALVLDEPTDGLDPNQKDQVRHLIETIAKDKAIILSTHILDEVEAVCSRVIIINRGQIVVDSDPRTLAARSRRHNAVHLRLSGISPQAAREQLGAIDGVRSVQYKETDDSFEIVPDEGQRIVQSVWQKVNSNGWKIKTISELDGRLDDVFRQLTRTGS